MSEANEQTNDRLELESQILGPILSGAPGSQDALATVLRAQGDFAFPHDRIVSLLATARANGLDTTAQALAFRLRGSKSTAAIADYVLSLARGAPAIADPILCQRQIRDGVAALRQAAARDRLREKLLTLGEAIDGNARRDALAEASDLQELVRRARGECEPEIEAKPYEWTEPEAIPPRDWLYAKYYVRQFVSMTVAPGGVGKSSLSVSEALAMTSGKPILGERVPKPCRVWLINLEDPRDELKRRIQAACALHRVTQADLGERLFDTGGRNHPCVIAQCDRAGAFIVQPVVDRLIAEIKEKRIDALIVDPFVASHDLPESDNTSINMVVQKGWLRIAEEANCAVGLVHHSRKNGDGEVTAESSRGASALPNACRIVRTLNRMTKDEATRAGVDNHRAYFRTIADKVNLVAPAENSDWFKLESIDLRNGAPSDYVGVVTSWRWPDAFDGLETGTLLAVQKRIAASHWKENPQATDWAGVAVAEVLGLDLNDPKDKSRCRTLLKTWITGGALRVVRRQDGSRHERPFIEVGQWDQT